MASQPLISHLYTDTTSQQLSSISPFLSQAASLHQSDVKEKLCRRWSAGELGRESPYHPERARYSTEEVEQWPRGSGPRKGVGGDDHGAAPLVAWRGHITEAWMREEEDGVTSQRVAVTPRCGRLCLQIVVHMLHLCS
jgi:hypothetical protein